MESLTGRTLKRKSLGLSVCWEGSPFAASASIPTETITRCRSPSTSEATSNVKCRERAVSTRGQEATSNAPCRENNVRRLRTVVSGMLQGNCDNCSPLHRLHSARCAPLLGDARLGTQAKLICGHTSARTCRENRHRLWSSCRAVEREESSAWARVIPGGRLFW